MLEENNGILKTADVVAAGISKEYFYQYVKKAGLERAAQRVEYQHQALTELKLLGYMAQLAMEQGCILPKQYEQITKKVADCQNMLGAWLNSDRKRLGM